MQAANTVSLSLFPLNTVLFPGGLLPLKIFEQRYLEMTKVCIRDGTPFGVCHIVQGTEAGPPASHSLVGCTSSIIDWDMPHLGMFQLRTCGGQPFRVLESSTRANGLIDAEVELIAAEPGAVIEDHVTLCRRLLEKIVERIGSEWFFPPARYDLPEWIAYRLAEALPLSAEVRQALLELPDSGARLAQLHAMIIESGMPQT